MNRHMTGDTTETGHTTTTLYCYVPLLRPASFATLPAGWVYVEAPREVAMRRPDLPASTHRHGVVGFTRRLSADEAGDYQLRFDGERPQGSETR